MTELRKAFRQGGLCIAKSQLRGILTDVGERHGWLHVGFCTGMHRSLTAWRSQHCQPMSPAPMLH
jgi:hypothetical protein